jgi:hypothetical protein
LRSHALGTPITVDDVSQAGFWRQLVPDLTLTEAGDHACVPAPELDASGNTVLKADLVREGYVQVNGLYDGDLCRRLAAGVSALRGHGLLPVFALVYDEYWLLARRLHAIMCQVLGDDYVQLPDFWAWFIDPTTEQSGWRPHRDKPSLECLMPDGAPKSVTAWIALTDVSPLNGCMYVVPAHMDPGYATATTPSAEDLLHRVRALPAAAGSVFIWNQLIMHWGGSSSRRADGPRISIAFEFQRADAPAFNEPLLRSPRILLPMQTRLALIGQQILQYTHMYGYHSDLVEAAKVLRSRL